MHLIWIWRRSVQAMVLSCVLFQGVAQDVVDDHPSRIVMMDLIRMNTTLLQAPLQSSSKDQRPLSMVELPMPEGLSQKFIVVESPIMDPSFAREYPSFKTYSLKSLTDDKITGRLASTPLGIQATILQSNGTIHIRPLPDGAVGMHEVARGHLGLDTHECGVIDDQTSSNFQRSTSRASGTNGSSFRTYTLAIVTTGEFYQNNGSSVSSARAVVVNSVNSIQAIYERDLAVKFNLLTPKIYTNPATDPFNQSNRTREAAEAVEANFSGQGYDVGHAFHSPSSGGSGVAQLGVICSNSSLGSGFRRGGGWSGSSNNSSIGWIGLASHEFGHMFDMPHSFNGSAGNCGGNISGSGAYEIGSGSTIMSYQGSCSPQNVPGSGAADNYFHANSIDRALTHLDSRSCETTTASGNNPPSISANPCGGTHTIPKSTPFRLTGSGVDADGDDIYYTWEQYDEDGNGTSTQGLIGSAAASSTIAPLFRSYPPSPDPTRYFPNIGLVAANDYASDFEALPTVARTLNFRLIGRDMKENGGGIGWSDLAISVSGSGPFALTSPNGGQNMSAGTNTTITWNRGGSGAYCNAVNIKLSVDGGLTYPYDLASNTANDGTESITIPAGVQNTSTARVMVESAHNTCVVFFDISDGNFTISSDCLASNSTICPTDPVSFPSGSSSLDLDLEHLFGLETSSHSVTINNGSPIGPIANGEVYGSTACQLPNWNPRKYGVIDFMVSESGDYTIRESFPTFAILSIFEADGYNPSDPCNSVFLGSNARGLNTIYTRSSATVSLNTCTVYKAVLWSTDGNGSGPLTFAGPGTIYEATDAPGSSYSYTYAAVNTNSNVVQLVNANADFRTLPLGTYVIYGASFYQGAGPSPDPVNPSLWVGMSLSQILAAGDCALFSNNTRNITVTGSCPPSTTVNDNPLASSVYQAAGSLSSAGKIISGSTVTFIAGDEVQLLPNFEVSINAVFEVFMQGCN